MALARSMYTAFRFGNVSAWVFWSLSEEQASDYSLMTTGGIKSKRYWVSKQFYRYVRPGAVRVETITETSDRTDPDLLPLAFVKDGLPTLVISNIGTTDKAIRVKGDGVSTQYKVFLTSVSENYTELTAIKAGESVTIPTQGVVTLVGVK